jgi:hypothetical protein
MYGSTSKLRNVLSWNMMPIEYPFSVGMSSTPSTIFPLISGKAFLRFVRERVTLLLAIVASHSGALVRAAFVLKHGRVPLPTYRRVSGESKEKSDLPNNSNFCPRNSGECDVVRQSPYGYCLA